MSTVLISTFFFLKEEVANGSEREGRKSGYEGVADAVVEWMAEGSMLTCDYLGRGSDPDSMIFVVAAKSWIPSWSCTACLETGVERLRGCHATPAIR